MTQRELDIEWQYRLEERLGIMCGGENPTPEQMQLATVEADIAVMRLGPPLEELLI
jgi:hypothetical protein